MRHVQQPRQAHIFSEVICFDVPLEATVITTDSLNSRTQRSHYNLQANFHLITHHVLTADFPVNRTSTISSPASSLRCLAASPSLTILRTVVTNLPNNSMAVFLDHIIHDTALLDHVILT